MDNDKRNEPVEKGTNEGEGNKSADERYRRNVDEFLDKEDPSKLARQAASDIEKNPGEYEEAERVGKSRIAEEDEHDKDLI
jgi:hypothetical protein